MHLGRGPGHDGATKECGNEKNAQAHDDCGWCMWHVPGVVVVRVCETRSRVSPQPGTALCQSPSLTIGCEEEDHFSKKGLRRGQEAGIKTENDGGLTIGVPMATARDLEGSGKQQPRVVRPRKGKKGKVRKI